MNKYRYFVMVKGIVQGVGFRPYVYKLAMKYNLKGWVNNNSHGVFIDIEGTKTELNIFLKELEHNPPSLSIIEDISFESKKLLNYADFSIKSSQLLEGEITLISPDTALCSDCIEDIKNPDNPRFKYPFTNCTNCGPRFSIIKDLPYDREKTTMKLFKMCSFCKDEYINPTNRRFHAQPIACSSCGPKVWLEDSKGNLRKDADPILATGKALSEGKIMAIKGLGGFHLCCDATNPIAIKTLRIRKHRPDKPFALMAKDINVVKKYCYVNSTEENLLVGTKKPIVILKTRENITLPQEIAPNQLTLGIMLPYTPLHYLLFDTSPEILIMTSANLNSLPLEYENLPASKSLNKIADLFLMHNRDIFSPIDDSVTRVIDDETISIRRARGYTPEPIKYNTKNSILSCGSNMKNTFCISKDNYIFMSQHNGDLENLETINRYKQNIEHFKNIFKFTPTYIACDKHPQYASTIYAKELNLPLIYVQHHHAHIVSCMLENNLKNKVIGIAFDGTGYGDDGAIWGGEFFFCDLSSYERFAHIEYALLPGGDLAINEPWRMAVSYINQAYHNTKEGIEIITSLYPEKGLILNSIIASKINCVKTSSIGRLFDAVSSILNNFHQISYEGQASIELENLIDIITTDYYDYKVITAEESLIISTSEIIKGVLSDVNKGLKKGYISAKFHNSIVKFSTEICCIIRSKKGVNQVVLSGGVFQNQYLIKNLLINLHENNFSTYINKLFPTNDGGVSLGQIVIADEIINKNML